MEPHLFITVAGLALAALAYLARYRRPECPECRHCRERTETEKATQATLRHDVVHKGSGFRPGDPDRYSCHDEGCKRNPKR